MYTIKNNALYIKNSAEITNIDIYKIALYLSSFDVNLSMQAINILQKTPVQKNISPIQIKHFLVQALNEKYPQRFFQCLRVVNILDQFFPELNNLIGVIQKNKYGSYYDVFDHTINCINQTMRHDPSVYSVWAALVHDLGKAKTKKNMLPNHYGHDVNGIELAQNLANRFLLNENFCIAGFLATSLHMNAHKVMILKPGKLICLLNKLRRFPGGIQKYFSFLKGDGAKNIDYFFAYAIYNFIVELQKQKDKYNEKKFQLYLCQQVSFEKRRLQNTGSLSS